MATSLVVVHWSCLEFNSDALYRLLKRLEWNGFTTAILAKSSTPETTEKLDLADNSKVVITSEHQLQQDLSSYLLATTSSQQAVFLLCNLEQHLQLQEMFSELNVRVWALCENYNKALQRCTPVTFVRELLDCQYPDTDTLVVGYTMKWSREKDLSQKGLLPYRPCDGLRFVPLDLSASLADQSPFHILLHKASDELEYDQDGQLVFSHAVQTFDHYTQQHPEICVVDPLSCTRVLADRSMFADALAGLDALDTGCVTRVCLPKCVVVMSFQDPELQCHLRNQGVTPPFIVKSVVACGTADSHEMAVVLSSNAIPLLSMHLPAVIQRYINHSGLVFKVYVLGEHVTYSTRPSIPDIRHLTAEEAATDDPSQHVLLFNALSALPKSLPSSFAAKTNDIESSHTTELDMSVLALIAKYIRQQLGLHLFGFDVIVEQGCSIYHVVDVNYLPNYREVQDAPRLLRVALKQAYAEHQATRQAGRHG